MLHQRAKLVVSSWRCYARPLRFGNALGFEAVIPGYTREAVKAPDTLWELVFLMVILKIPIVYLCGVV